MNREVRELAAPLVAREWLQRFWETRGRLPYRYEIPSAFWEWFPGGRVPVGWAAELELMGVLRRLGLGPSWSPGSDAAGVDVRFTLVRTRVRVQLKVRREATAVRWGILHRTPHAVDLLLVLPTAAVGRLDTLAPQWVDLVRRRLSVDADRR